MGALVPLVKVAHGRTRGFLAIAFYTVGGAGSSLLIGALLGALGAMLIPGTWQFAGLLFVMSMAGVAAAYEMGLIPLALPQVNRQTNIMWGRRFSTPLAAALWGIDLGLVVTTRVTYAGTWAVLLFATASRHTAAGAVILLAYWLGRASQVWLVALLLRSTNELPRFLQRIYMQSSIVQRVHVASLIWALAVLALLIRKGGVWST